MKATVSIRKTQKTVPGFTSNAELIAALGELQEALERLEGKRDRIRQDLRNMPVGKYEGFTVYKVGRVEVRPHTRRPYRAVRISRSPSK